MYRLECHAIDDAYRKGAASVVVRDFAEALYRTVRTEQPGAVLEIGMANGVTSTAIAQALSDNGSGRVISIDPHQTTDWESGGLSLLAAAGLSDLHELREEPDFVALPALLADGQKFDLVYIDGLHSLEYVLLDFFYADRLLNIGGVVGFNDCDWPAVIPTLKFVEKYRRYERLSVGLSPTYEASNRVARKVAGVAPKLFRRNRLLGPLIGRRCEDRYYRKLSSWEPPEAFYRGIAGRAHPSSRF
jgi:predicted O-methyltransferase YrrM